MLSRMTGVPHGVMFHRFVPESRISAQGSLTASRLRKVLLSLSRDGVVSPSEWLERLAEGRLDGHRCLTFDDGLRAQFVVALPVLQEVGLEAFWFIPTGVFGDARPVAEVLAQALDRVDNPEELLQTFCGVAERLAGASPSEPALAIYREQAQRRFPFYTDLDCKYRFVRNSMPLEMLEQTVHQVLVAHRVDRGALESEIFLGAADVRALVDAGQTVGLHSHSQPYDLGQLPVDQQRTEYLTNLQTLEAITGVRPVSVAHPLGSYSSETLELLGELGVVCGFRSDARRGVGLTVGAGPLEFARADAVSL